PLGPGAILGSSLVNAGIDIGEGFLQPEYSGGKFIVNGIPDDVKEFIKYEVEDDSSKEDAGKKTRNVKNLQNVETVTNGVKNVGEAFQNFINEQKKKTEKSRDELKEKIKGCRDIKDEIVEPSKKMEDKNSKDIVKIGERYSKKLDITDKKLDITDKKSKLNKFKFNEEYYEAVEQERIEKEEENIKYEVNNIDFYILSEREDIEEEIEKKTN
ncbi:MAG: hypothetical protein F6K34_01605, partial [Okeania sp. SIO4D6]|nr:hypothetical protein [Okeania sp. SIO4D6]